MGALEKTAAAIVEIVGRRLLRRPARMEIGETLYGDQVRASRMTGVPERVRKTILFVHNPDPEAHIPAVLFGLGRSRGRYAGAARRTRAEAVQG
jgi:hypothetical protein